MVTGFLMCMCVTIFASVKKFVSVNFFVYVTKSDDRWGLLRCYVRFSVTNFVRVTIFLSV